MPEKTMLELKREREFAPLKDTTKWRVMNKTDRGTVITEFRYLDELMHKLRLDAMTIPIYGGTVEFSSARLEKVIG
jgi:hypothetical protein